MLSALTAAIAIAAPNVSGHLKASKGQEEIGGCGNRVRKQLQIRGQRRELVCPSSICLTRSLHCWKGSRRAHRTRKVFQQSLRLASGDDPSSHFRLSSFAGGLHVVVVVAFVIVIVVVVVVVVAVAVVVVVVLVCNRLFARLWWLGLFCRGRRRRQQRETLPRKSRDLQIRLPSM
jgi:hypothetical protein